MKHTLITIISFLLLVIFVGCNVSDETGNSHINNWKSESSSSPEINRQIEQIQKTIKRLYSTNPDSAIFFYLKIIDVYEQQQMPHNVFDAYIKISELYCFRKNDGFNAVYYYGEALKTMNKYGGFEDSDPFFYIDMGNMFYMNKLYPQAHKSFDKAINIAIQKNDEFAISVAQNNNGIVFREEGNYDASKLFFRKSLAIRSKITPLYEAQNYLYLAKVFTYQNNADSIFYYRNLAIQALQKHSSSKVNPAIITETAAKALADGFQIYELELMALASQIKNEPVQTLNYFQNALERAGKAEDQESRMVYLYNISDLNNKLNRQTEAVKYATQAYQMAVDQQNLVYSVRTSKLLNQLFTKLNNLNQANFYLNKIIGYTDSLNQKESSEKIQSARILLITNEVEESVRHYQSQVKKNQEVVKIQSKSIVALTIFLLAAFVFIFFIYRKRVLLKKEHMKQIETILQNLDLEEKKRKLRKSEGNNDFYSEMDEKLITLMEVEKIYLHKNITLAELADKLETNVTYLSQYINNQQKTNFNDYINSHRINEACRLFRSNTSLKLTIDQVADLVGFSSRTTFYTTFKKFTGITPAFFQKYILTPEVQYSEENKTGTNE